MTEEYIKKIDMVELRKKLENMTPKQLQEYVIEMEKKHKHLRYKMRAEKETFHYIVDKHGIKL